MKVINLIENFKSGICEMAGIEIIEQSENAVISKYIDDEMWCVTYRNKDHCFTNFGRAYMEFLANK